MSRVPISFSVVKAPPSRYIDLEANSDSASITSGLKAFDRAPRLIILIMLTWSVIHPSVHYYLGQINLIEGAFGVTWAGLIDVFMFGLGVVVLVRCIFRERLYRPVLFFPLLFYFLAILYALVLSPVPTLAIRNSVVYVVPFLFFLDIVFLSRDVNLSSVLARLAILAAVIPLAMAVLQALSPSVPGLRELLSVLPIDPFSLDPYPGLGVPRVSGTLFSYNPFAVFMGIVFLAVVLRLNERLSGVWQVAFLLLGGAMIVAAFMRALWLALAISLLLVTVLAGGRTRLILLILGATTMLVIAVTPLSGLISNRISDQASVIDRQSLSDFGWQSFFDQPWGYGSGSGRLLTLELAWSETFQSRGDIVTGYSFHNEYVTAAVEGGIFLLGAYVFLLVCLFAFGARTARLARQLKRNPQWGIWLMAATLLLTLTGLTDGGIGYSGFVFWLLAAGVEMDYRAMHATISGHGVNIGI